MGFLPFFLGVFVLLLAASCARCAGVSLEGEGASGADVAASGDGLSDSGTPPGFESLNLEEEISRYVSDEEALSAILAGLSGADVTVEYTGDDTAATAARVLEGIEEQKDSVLAWSGYLDLLGSTWACVSEGRGWVKICVVQEDADSKESVIWELLLDAAVAGDLFGEL